MNNEKATGAKETMTQTNVTGSIYIYIYKVRNSLIPSLFFLPYFAFPHLIAWYIDVEKKLYDYDFLALTPPYAINTPANRWH